MKWIADIEKDHKSSIKSLRLGFNRAELNSTSWKTAQAVGALGLMDYREVKRNAAVYELQEEFLRLQTRAGDLAIAAIGPLTTHQGDSGKASFAELEEEKRHVDASLSALFVDEQIGKQLQDRYASRLENK